MKDIGNKFKEGAKKVVKGLSIGVPLYFTALTGFGQEQTENYKDFLNPFFKDSLYNKTNQLDYYGSGDLTKNGALGWDDAQVMAAGLQSYLADVDGDGIPSTAADKKILEEYLTGERDRMPMNWKSAETVEQRMAILEAFRNIDDTWVYNPTKTDWDCNQYGELAFFKTSSVAKADSSDWFNNFHFIEQNMKEVNEKWGQIPAYLVYSKTAPGQSYEYHLSLGFCVGSDDLEKDNSLNPNSWKYLNTSNGEWMGVGSTLMYEDGEIRIKAYVLGKDIETGKDFHGRKKLLKINLTNGQGEIMNPREGIITKRPASTGIFDQSFKKNGLENNLTIYPNPITNGNDLNIKSTLSEGYLGREVNYNIFDTAGKLLKKGKCDVNQANKSFIIPGHEFNELPTALYLIRMENSKGKFLGSKKIKKQKP